MYNYRKVLEEIVGISLEQLHTLKFPICQINVTTRNNKALATDENTGSVIGRDVSIMDHDIYYQIHYQNFQNIL